MTGKTQAKPSPIMGPVDYLVLMFPGNQFRGEIIPELSRLEKNGIIRVIDMVLVLKDAKGKVLITEAKNVGGKAGDAFSSFAEKTREWLSQGDIEAIAGVLPNNCSAGILLFENTWAIPFKAALIRAGAELVDMGRIPPEAIRKVEMALAAKEV
ncbi:MAG: DUF6325 family protein [Methanomicrobiales archaeon]|jgi:hypothetical protein|nr:DUF6325 family protein [Methanomicrobiales archaeon]